MNRYYNDPDRTAHHRVLLYRNRFVTYEQLLDICELIKEGKAPDETFHSCEAEIYELLKRELVDRI